MASVAPNDNDQPRTENRAAVVVAWMHEHFLWLLVASYLLAAVVPGPGLMLRGLSWGNPYAGEITAPMLLLALLLFCAAAVVRWEQVWSLMERPGVLVVGLLASWLVPTLFVTLLGTVLPDLIDPTIMSGLLVGLALVAAMPVANSSAGWTQNARGNVALSLGLVVLSILLSPLATPNLLKLMGLVLSQEDTHRIEQVVNEFSGSRFILWVILPSLAGAAAAWLAGHDRIARAKPWFRLITLVDILVLNYASASLSIQNILKNEQFGVVAVAAALAILVSVVGVALAALQCRICKLPRSTWIALLFSLSMKHTGLALVLASEVLHDQPRVILVILLTTLAQHLIAAAIDWKLSRAAFGPEPE
jgi:BASS family bile acid:Na+ symporter